MFLAVGMAAPCDRICLDNAIATQTEASLLEVIPTLSEVATPQQAAALRARLGPSSDDAATENTGFPRTGDVFIDGRLSVNRPLNSGTLLQQTSPEKQVLLSAWLRPGDPLPEWAGQPLEVAEKARLLGKGVVYGIVGAVVLVGVMVVLTVVEWLKSPGPHWNPDARRVPE
jgi:hypothetical protein